MSDCVFCRIVRGELPCSKVYEDERVIGFLDANPISPGHTLILPRAHYATLFEIPEEDLRRCAVASQKVARAVFKAVNAAGLNYLQNNFRPAGQRVDHIHFHLIPRFPRDGFFVPWEVKPYAAGEMEKTLQKIRAQLQ